MYHARNVCGWTLMQSGKNSEELNYHNKQLLVIIVNIMSFYVCFFFSFVMSSLLSYIKLFKCFLIFMIKTREAYDTGYRYTELGVYYKSKTQQIGTM